MDLTDIQKHDDQVSNEEIKKANFDMKPWKAPAQTNFQRTFIKGRGI